MAASTASSAATASAARPRPDRRAADGAERPCAASRAKLLGARSRAAAVAPRERVAPRDFPGGAAPASPAGRRGVLLDADPLKAVRAGAGLGGPERRARRPAPPGRAAPRTCCARRAACFALAADGVAGRRHRRCEAAVPPAPAAVAVAPPSLRRHLAELLVDADARGGRRGRHRARRGARARGGSHRATAPRTDRRADRRAAPRGRRRPADRELTAMLHGRLSPADQLRARGRDRAASSAAPVPSATRSTSWRRSAGCAPAASPTRSASAWPACGRSSPPCPARTCATRGGDGARGDGRTGRPWSWRARSASTSTSCRRPPTPASASPRTPASCSWFPSATPTRSPSTWPLAWSRGRGRPVHGDWRR